MKYPRTFHIPESPGCTTDDKVLLNLDHLFGQECIISKKMDGENTTMTSELVHARSVDSRNHPSRNWVKQFHGQIAHQIPAGWRICGENLFATHSIEYRELQSYFYAFSIWNEKNIALDWNSTLEWCDILNITPVEILFKGVLSKKVINSIIMNLCALTDEGFVIRLASEFHYNDFKMSVAKYVRANHITSDKHWMHSQLKQNTLK